MFRLFHPLLIIPQAKKTAKEGNCFFVRDYSATLVGRRFSNITTGLREDCWGKNYDRLMTV